MSTHTTARFKKQSEEILKNYHAEIEKMAKAARDALMPLFKARKWTFRSGNGTWFIERTDKPNALLHDRVIEDDDLPKWARELLWIEFDHNNLLGFWIADITEGDLL